MTTTTGTVQVECPMCRYTAGHTSWCPKQLRGPVTERAAAYFDNAQRLGIPAHRAADIADDCLDRSHGYYFVVGDEAGAFCHLAAREAFTSDDDFDDFRAELRAAL